jgi:hypothetical protein
MISQARKTMRIMRVIKALVIMKLLGLSANSYHVQSATPLQEQVGCQI